MVIQEENVQLLQDGANHLQYSCKRGVFPALYGNAWDQGWPSRGVAWPTVVFKQCNNLTLVMKLAVALNYENVTDFYKIWMLWIRLMFNKKRIVLKYAL